MTGLEKIKSQILDEARSSADAKIRDAEKQAEDLLEEAKEQAGRDAGKILAKARDEAESLKEKTISSADLERRTRILSAKQEMIADVLEQARREVGNMNTETYFSLIERMLDQYVLGQEGKILFSPADMERMPRDFQDKIRKAAAAKGGSLAPAEGDPRVTDGFVLIYGGIEENCTFSAIFDARHDEMSDRVQRMLFS